jgi:NAD(P)-dependent dehydrogenase (short-subunit alcohol dehydrogenase family)
LILIKRYFDGVKCNSKIGLTGKVAIVTGANTGIGYETALDFAQRDARVIIACRNLDKANAAAEKIKKLSNNNKVQVEKLDLSDLSSVRKLAEKMNSTLNKLDLLINNAGIMATPYTKTIDGFEMQFGTNHLGPFLLTNLLLPLLKKAEGSRIINVSSIAHECTIQIFPYNLCFLI